MIWIEPPCRLVDGLGVARAAAALVLLAILPGLVWSRVLLPRSAKRLDHVVASVVLSVLMLVLALYVGNVVAGVEIAGTTAVGWSLSLTLAGCGVLITGALQKRLVVASV